MRLYLDADIFLALIKDQDRFKESAQHFFEISKHHIMITSSSSCLEVWFYLHKNNHANLALDAVRAIKSLVQVIDWRLEQLEEALFLAQNYKLTPADALHAVIASHFDGIVSTDKSFDRIKGLKRIDFSAESK